VTDLIMKWVQKMGATLFFIGYIPPMPGTLGSAAVIGTLWYTHLRVPAFFEAPMVPFFWFAILGLITISIVLSSNAEEIFGKEDPGCVIIDECAGQLITFFLIPITWRTLLLGFVLFRFFDIVKPFPVYKLEEVDGGVGITMDDVAAGVLANIVMAGILFLFQQVKLWL